MKGSTGKAKTFPRTKTHNETSGGKSGAQKTRSRDRISRAVKRFVHTDREKVNQSSDSKEDSCKENDIQSAENESCNDQETLKLIENKVQKKRFKKRASVAILVDKFEHEVRAVKSKVSKVKLQKTRQRGSFDHNRDLQKVRLSSVSLPPAPLSSSSDTESEDREVELILSSPNQGSDEELFVPRGFNSNHLLTRKQAQRRKDFRGWSKSENDAPVTPRSETEGVSSSKPSPEITDLSNSNLVLRRNLKAGDLASILKNRKSDNRSSENITEHGSEADQARKRMSVENSAAVLKPRQLARHRSQSEHGIMPAEKERIKLAPKLSAPSAAFFLNNTSPLGSSSHPNLSKVLEVSRKESTGEEHTKDLVYENMKGHGETVYESPTATPPLHRQFEEPLQGFQVVRHSSFQPRELSTTPPRSVLAPKPRTPVSFLYPDKLSSLETLLCEMMSKLDRIDTCTGSGHGAKKRVHKRRSNKVSLNVRFSREQRCMRKQLARIDKTTSLLAKRVNIIYRKTLSATAKPRQLADIVTYLHLEDYRSVLEGEGVTGEDFYLLTTSDLKEMGIPVGIRRRILNHIKH